MYLIYQLFSRLSNRIFSSFLYYFINFIPKKLIIEQIVNFLTGYCIFILFL